MATRKFFDRSQPQTLQNAVILCYINSALSLIYAVGQGGVGLALLAILPLGLAAWGIANDSKLGYVAAVVLASLNLALIVFILADVRFHGSSISVIFNLAFAIILVYLLVHPVSRSYARIWFRWKI